MTQHLGKAVKKGISWSFTCNVLRQILQFGFGIALARILTPKDFGLVGMVYIVKESAGLFADFGLNAALIQKKDVTRDDADTIFVASLVLGVALFVIVSAISPLAAAFFGNDLIKPLLVLSAVNFVINPFGSVAASLMSRKIQFREKTIAVVTASLVHGLVSVSLAVAGWGVWSLVCGNIASSVVSVVMNCVMAGHLPRFRFNRERFGTMISFGSNFFGKSFLIYLKENVDFFIVGKALGPEQLGFYTRAFDLMTLPQRQLSASIQGVVFPAFSTIQDEDERISSMYRRLITGISTLAFPALVGMMIVAPEFIVLTYGEKWLPAAVPLQILCAAGMVRSIISITSIVFDAKGQVNLNLRLEAFNLALLATGVLVAYRWGIQGVAWSVLATTLFSALVMFFVLSKLIGLRFREQMSQCMPAVIGSLAMGLVLLLYKATLGEGLVQNQYLSFGLEVVLGMLIYGVIIVGFPFRHIRETFPMLAR